MEGIPNKFKDFKRFQQVLNTLMKYELGFLLDSLHPHSKDSKPITEPQTIRRIIEELGGSFVKLGQLLSLRPDLIPSRYCEELGLLQDSVKPFSYSEAKKIIERDLKRKIPEIFSSFPNQPIASASIGQVYRARLKSGEFVAVKVQRPGIKGIMDTDIEIMTIIAKQLKKHIKPGIMDPEEIVGEFKSYTENELSYLAELQRIVTFHASFKGTRIRIPKPYQQYSSEKVLVMEFIEGEKLNDYIKGNASQERRKELADELVNSFFKQVFIDGTFHADPHPGNILVLDLKKYPEQSLAFLDFGISGDVNQEIKKDLLSLFIAMINKDLEGIATAMMRLHLIKQDTPELRKDMKEMLHPYYNVSLHKIDISKIFLQTIKIAKKYQVKVPRDYILLGKSIVTLESVCTLLYPDFNIVESAKPFLARIMIEKHRPRQMLQQGITKMTQFERFVEEMPEMVKQYFDQNSYQTEYLKELAEHMYSAQKRTDVLMERFMLGVVGFILLITGFFLAYYGSNNESMSIFSIFSFILAFAVFFLLIRSFASRH